MPSWRAYWRGEGQEIEACSIIVTDANDLLRSIHDRVPVTRPGRLRDLAEPGKPKRGGAGHRLLVLYPAKCRETVPVGRSMNNPRINGASRSIRWRPPKRGEPERLLPGTRRSLNFVVEHQRLKPCL